MNNSTNKNKNMCDNVEKNVFIYYQFFDLDFREDTHKKGVFLVVGPLRFYPPY